MKKYQHRRHDKNLLMVHLILVTKYRKKLLTGKIRKDMKEILFQICLEHKWYVVRMETDQDHIHILIQYNPTDSITRMVSRLKQDSTWRIWQLHEERLRTEYWKKKIFWSDGYFAESVGQVSQETIGKYIENQG